MEPYEANTAMHHADVIFAIGARFDDRVTNDLEKFCPHATIIHVDVDPTSVSKNIEAHIPIVGTCNAVLSDDEYRRADGYRAGCKGSGRMVATD